MLAKPCAAALAVLLALPCRAQAPHGGVLLSTGTASEKKPLAVELGLQKAQGSGGTATVGVGVGLEEGKPLEMLLWGSGGAVAGSFAGPLGAAAGGAAGMLAGLFVAVFIVPHNGPEEKRRPKPLPSRPDN